MPEMRSHARIGVRKRDASTGMPEGMMAATWETCRYCGKDFMNLLRCSIHEVTCPARKRR